MSYRENQREADPFDNFPTSGEMSEIFEATELKWTKEGADLAFSNPTVVKNILNVANHDLSLHGSFTLIVREYFPRSTAENIKRIGCIYLGIISKFDEAFRNKGYKTRISGHTLVVALA